MHLASLEPLLVLLFDEREAISPELRFHDKAVVFLRFVIIVVVMAAATLCVKELKTKRNALSEGTQRKCFAERHLDPNSGTSYIMGIVLMWKHQR